jgi:hypothetical protein
LKFLFFFEFSNICNSMGMISNLGYLYIVLLVVQVLEYTALQKDEGQKDYDLILNTLSYTEYKYLTIVIPWKIVQCIYTIARR